MTSPYFTIVTINLNNKIGLKKTIESVIIQTFNNYQFIIIDGKSTDGSVDLLIENQKYIDYWISDYDTGIYNAMNKGLKQAKGKYILFLNSGDYLRSSEVLNYVRNKKITADVIYANLFHNDRNYEQVFPANLNIQYLLFSALGHPSMFFKGELFKTYSYREDFKIISDWIIIFELYNLGYSFEYLNYTVSVFEGNGISSNPIKITEEGKRYLTEKYGKLGEYILGFREQNKKSNILNRLKMTLKSFNLIKTKCHVKRPINNR